MFVAGKKTPLSFGSVLSQLRPKSYGLVSRACYALLVTAWPEGTGTLMRERPDLEELNHLYENLLPEERDELLQCLLIAAPRGEEAMIRVLEQTLLCHATEDLRDNWVPPSASGAN